LICQTHLSVNSSDLARRPWARNIHESYASGYLVGQGSLLAVMYHWLKPCLVRNDYVFLRPFHIEYIFSLAVTDYVLCPVQIQKSETFGTVPYTRDQSIARFLLTQQKKRHDRNISPTLAWSLVGRIN
jgi:hypothetical protein